MARSIRHVADFMKNGEASYSSFLVKFSNDEKKILFFMLISLILQS